MVVFTSEGRILIGNGALFVIHELHHQGLSISAIARAHRSGPQDGAQVPQARLAGAALRSAGAEAAVAGPVSGVLARTHRGVSGDACHAPAARDSPARLPRLLRATDCVSARDSSSTGPGLRAPLRDRPGEQAQVDFAQFKTEFAEAPGRVRVVWLFSLVLGHCRWLTGHFVYGQHLASVLCCHMQAFAELGGVPRQILYDRMKTAVLGEDEARHVIYHPRLLELAEHYGFTPRAGAPYRAKTKGKVERPFSYIRDDFFLGGGFTNLEDLNAQFAAWRSRVANVRCHGTTRRVISEAFAEEQAQLLPLPKVPFNTVLSLQRRVSHDGMVSVNGNLYSVPDRTRRRVVDVHTLANEVRIYEGQQLLAVHALLHGRGQRRLAPAHRRWPPPGSDAPNRAGDVVLSPPGHTVHRRDLGVYDRIGHALAGGERP